MGDSLPLNPSQGWEQLLRRKTAKNCVLGTYINGQHFLSIYCETGTVKCFPSIHSFKAQEDRMKLHLFYAHLTDEENGGSKR